jgi:hypothetical protein
MIVQRNIQGRPICVECGEAYARMAANVLDAFSGLAESRAPLGPGTQIRFGWSVLRLVEEGPAWRVTEPDFTRWTEGYWASTLDTTLRVLSMQTSLLHRLGVTGEDAFCDQWLFAASNALTHANVFLRRGASRSAEDSGWLLGALEDPDALARGDNLEAFLLASLVVSRPALLEAVVLPRGFIAIYSGNSLDQVFDAAGHHRLDANSQIPSAPTSLMDTVGKPPHTSVQAGLPATFILKRLKDRAGKINEQSAGAASPQNGGTS